VRIDAVTVGENRIALGDLCVRYRAITAWLGLRDLAVILKLNFQIFNQLGQPFARKGVAGSKACASFRLSSSRYLRFVSVLLPSRRRGL